MDATVRFRARLALLPALAVAGFAVSVPARAGQFSGTVALSSQLVDRGFAITPETAIAQGAVSWTSLGGWSVGASASTEVRSAAPIAEAIAHASRYWALSADWQMQAGLAYYDYPSHGDSQLLDRAEASLNWSYRDVLTLGFSAIYGVGSGAHRLRGAGDIDFHWPLPWHFSLAAGAGIAQYVGNYASAGGYDPGSYYGGSYASYYPSHRTQTYGYGHAGLVWSVGSWRMELDRIFVEQDMRRQWGSHAPEPWVATLSLSF